MGKLSCIILCNEDPLDHLLWQKTCEVYSDRISYELVDLTKSDWLNHFSDSDDRVLLTKPSGKTWAFRQLYEERLEILVNCLGYTAFPGLPEIRIYENKRFFAYWAQANKIPHPKTRVFYSEERAQDFIANCTYPQVGKLNIGASGNGISILSDLLEAAKYVKKAFNEGLTSRVGPKLKHGKIIQRLFRKLSHPEELRQRLNTYKAIVKDRQQGYLILQEYILHDFEWRVVRVGESFFAHKKLAKKGKASGSLKKSYENPPFELLNFVKKLTDRFKMYSMAVDIFENLEGEYLVNEMQCIFGQSDPYQMLVDGKLGRYRYTEDKWMFEEGDFARNACYNLRLDFVLQELKRQN